MSEEEYKEKSQSLPDVCLAFKCQIPNMDTVFNGPKPLITADLSSLVGGDEPINSTLSNKKVNGVHYTASAKVGTDDLKVTLSESEYL